MIQLAEPFRRSHALERQMGSIFVVFGFPFLEFSGQIPFIFETPSPIELLRVGLVASTFPFTTGQPGGMCLWEMRRSERCQVNCGPNEEPLSVWIFWIAKGKCSRTSRSKSIAVLVLSWS